MKQLTKRFILESAKPEHGKELIEILEENDFKGRISLIYTRRPDAYLSLKKEGEQVNIVICRDLENDLIISFGACAIRKWYVNRRMEQVGYLFGLRARKKYRGTYAVISKGYEFLYSFYKQSQIPFFITTILEENLYARKLLEKKRTFMPYYEPLGVYEIYTLKTGCKMDRNTHLKFKRAEKRETPLLVDFLNFHGRNCQFFPVIEEKDLVSGTYPYLSIEDFFILYGQEGEILAAGAAWDQVKYKQYIMQEYRGLFKLLYPFSSLLPVLGYPSLAKPGTTLKFFTLSFWVVKENNPELFKLFLNNLASQIGQISQIKDYPFFIIGLHEQNPLRPVLQKIPHILYKSRVYSVNWQKTGLIKDKLEPTLVPYLECGLL